MKLYKILAVVVILSILLGNAPEVQAQGGGRCVRVYPRYYSARCGCYLSLPPYWKCSGTTQPRRFSPRRY